MTASSRVPAGKGPVLRRRPFASKRPKRKTSQLLHRPPASGVVRCTIERNCAARTGADGRKANAWRIVTIPAQGCAGCSSPCSSVVRACGGMPGICHFRVADSRAWDWSGEVKIGGSAGLAWICNTKSWLRFQWPRSPGLRLINSQQGERLCASVHLQRNQPRSIGRLEQSVWYTFNGG